MPAPRLALSASALLALGLCCSVTASHWESRIRPGFVTDYITPMANLSVDKLVGRWYVAEHMLSLRLPENVTEALCFTQDFHYDENKTLVVEPITLMHGVRASTGYTLPVSDNGVWDYTDDGVIRSSQVVVELSEDGRFLAVASCSSGSAKDCTAAVMVRRTEDGARGDRLAELRRRLARAGVGNADTGLLNVIQPCRLIPAPSPDLNADNAPSTPDTE